MKCAGGCDRDIVPVQADDAGQQQGPWYCEECFVERLRRATPQEEQSDPLNDMSEEKRWP